MKRLKVAPSHGYYILRPSEVLQFEDHEKPNSLNRLITALGAEPVHYDGETKCCGFPVLFVQRETASKMAAAYLKNAKQSDADCLVTPCPLCHISLDTHQGKSAKQIKAEINLPVMHLSQIVGLALGVDAKKLGFSKHMVSMGQVLREL